jgi:hypothetical protein
MPRLSLYRPNKSNDFKYLDKNIKEMFVVGGTDLYVHKYVGIPDTGPSADFTQPQYDTLDPKNIQDLLFLENRDRKYDPNIYRLRGHYNVQNLDFDLSQFGLFLNNDIIFITIHYNDMIDVLGRKLIVGDVLELPHLTDYHPLNEAIPIGLRRYYQITDGNFASEGFSQTWYPHLWRIKCEPLVDSQEFSNILSQPIDKDNYLGDWDKTATYVPGYTVTYGDKTYTTLANIPAGIPCTGPTYNNTTAYPAGGVVVDNGITYLVRQDAPIGTAITNTNYFTPVWQLSTADNLKDIISRYNTNIAINDAAIAEAARLLPKNGYDRSQLYVVPTFDGAPAPPVNVVIPNGAPNLALGQVQLFRSGNFNPTPVIRVAAAALDNLWKLTADDADALKKFLQVSLETAKVAPQRLDTGSGQVEGNTILTAKALGPVTGPYGTADNTYATADQYPSIEIVTSALYNIGNTIIQIQNLFPTDTPDTWFNNPGLNIGTTVLTPTGVRVNAFNIGTKIINVDTDNSTVTISSPTIASIPIGSILTVGADFIGNPIQQNIMDYRADADPRFQFIARIGPNGYGYLDGYVSGDGSAPNGFPTGAGITFSPNPKVGDYFLRTDYLPQQLFRWSGTLWVKISENVRTQPTTVSDTTLLGSYLNNTATTTLTDGTVIPQQQSLSSILKITPD